MISQLNLLNTYMNFAKLVEEVLFENSMMGGSMSVMGPNVAQTATPISGDNLAKGDGRNVYGQYSNKVSKVGGPPTILTRSGALKPRSSKRNKRSRRRKK